MCCRFYYSREGAERAADDLGIDRIALGDCHFGTIKPSDAAVMITDTDKGLTFVSAKWGFPGKGMGLIINARAESVFEKPMFRNSALYRRCVLIAERFFEWDPNRNMVTFQNPLNQVMYLAGIWSIFDDKLRFTVLTTAANESMLPVHDRMPLLLEKEDLSAWLLNKVPSFSNTVRAMIAKDMPQLDRIIENEQLRMF